MSGFSLIIFQVNKTRQYNMLNVPGLHLTSAMLSAIIIIRNSPFVKEKY